MPVRGRHQLLPAVALEACPPSNGIRDISRDGLIRKSKMPVPLLTSENRRPCLTPTLSLWQRNSVGTTRLDAKVRQIELRDNNVWPQCLQNCSSMPLTLAQHSVGRTRIRVLALIGEHLTEFVNANSWQSSSAVCSAAGRLAQHGGHPAHMRIAAFATRLPAALLGLFKQL